MGGISWLANDLAARYLFYTRNNEVDGLVRWPTRQCNLIRSYDDYRSRADRQSNLIDGPQFAPNVSRY
jgi:hypothetical protein